MDFYKGIDYIKAFLGGMYAYLTSYFFPVNDFLQIIIGLFTINFAVGWYASKLNSEKFSLSKAFSAIKDLFIFFGLIVFVYIIGQYMKVEQVDTIQFISWLTWLIIYFYCVNITKNLKFIAPKNSVIGVLYWFLNIEFVKKIPFLQDYIKSKSNENKSETD